MKIQEFDFTANVTDSILWQYNSATNILTLINDKQAWLLANQTEFWQEWYDTVFNLCTTTPTLFGMSVWSIILNVPLFVPINPESLDKPIWGFNAYNPSFPTLENTYVNFFGPSSTTVGGNFSTRGQYFALTIEQQQFLLRLRYFDLCNLGDVVDINQFLAYLCTNNLIGYTGTIYVSDHLDMTISYTFTTLDFPIELLDAILELDLLPRPAGVEINFIYKGEPAWGFGYANKNFGNGCFIPFL